MTFANSLAIVMLLPVGVIAHSNVQPRALTEFLGQVAEYVETRRLVTAGVEGPAFCSDQEELFRQTEQRAAAIRDARPRATEGTIFTPRAAAFFRARIGGAARAAAIAVPKTGEYDDLVLEVHRTLPWNVREQALAPLIESLPLIPDELEYRFVGRHLVLLDVETNLIVDVLREAFLVDAPYAVSEAPDACTVHPQMPACWL